ALAGISHRGLGGRKWRIFSRYLPCGGLETPATAGQETGATIGQETGATAGLETPATAGLETGATNSGRV
ncbi:MAG: hypothetical protein WCC73_07685, partial [Terracidiphilus sp.]